MVPASRPTLIEEFADQRSLGWPICTHAAVDLRREAARRSGALLPVISSSMSARLSPHAVLPGR